jgi:hypothetical protein
MLLLFVSLIYKTFEACFSNKPDLLKDDDEFFPDLPAFIVVLLRLHTVRPYKTFSKTNAGNCAIEQCACRHSGF